MYHLALKIFQFIVPCYKHNNIGMIVKVSLIASFRCLVTVVQSQGTLRLIIGEKRPSIIELIYRLPPCHVNKMTYMVTFD